MEMIKCHKYDTNKVYDNIDNWEITDQLKYKITLFLKKYASGEITGNVLDKGSITRYAQYLKVAVENISSFDEKGISKFKENFLSDKIKGNRGSAFSLRGKKELLNVVIRFIEFNFPNKLTSLKKILEIKIRIKKNDIETLTDDEAERLIKETKPLDKKFLLEVLNHSGMRAEEFHNVRYSDIILPKNKSMYIKINLRNEFSKTEGRTITLFGKNSLKIVKEFLAYRLEEGMKPEDPVFPTTYFSAKKWMARHGKKVLGKNVYYHLWRHTCATRLSSKLNRQQLCIFFGWKFSSPMPDIYIKRSGVNMIDVEEKFANTDIEDLKKEYDNKLEEKKQELQIKIELSESALGKRMKLIETLMGALMKEKRNEDFEVYFDKLVKNNPELAKSILTLAEEKQLRVI
jgi:integrase